MATMTPPPPTMEQLSLFNDELIACFKRRGDREAIDVILMKYNGSTHIQGITAANLTLAQAEIQAVI